MVYLKSGDEIRILREGGRRLAAILSRLANEVRPGVHTAYLEEQANRWIEEAGGAPAFKGYPMGDGITFPSTLCVSINDQVVHGSALPDRIIAAGDIVDLDIGMEWPVTPALRREFAAPVNTLSAQGGYFTDTCVTLPVGKVSAAVRKLIKITRACLEAGIKAARPGQTVNDIGRAVEAIANRHGYGVVRDLVGHGLGYKAHERPDIFHYAIPEDRKSVV